MKKHSPLQCFIMRTTEINCSWRFKALKEGFKDDFVNPKYRWITAIGLLLGVYVFILVYTSKEEDLTLFASIFAGAIGTISLQTWLRRRVFNQSLKPKTESVRLPKLSLFCAAMMHKPEDREAMLGCMEERFTRDLKNHGKLWAKSIFWWDILMSIYPAVTKLFRKLIVGYFIEKIIPK
jgi:hypothetical protein